MEKRWLDSPKKLPIHEVESVELENFNENKNFHKVKENLIRQL